MKAHKFLVRLIALCILLALQGGCGPPPTPQTEPAQQLTLSPEEALRPAIVPTDSAGPDRSEADQFVTPSPKGFEWQVDPAEPFRVPITGIEQAILEGLEARFPDPQTLLQQTMPADPELSEGNKAPGQP